MKWNAAMARLLSVRDDTRRNSAWPAILLLLSAGCAVGPNYKRPETAVPPQWPEVGPNNGSPARTGSTDLIRWWTGFRDEALNSLVDRAVRSNKDLQIAQARIREARAQRIIAGGAGLPTVNASGSYTRISGSSASSAAFGAGSSAGATGSSAAGRGTSRAFDLFQAGLDASWEADIFGGVRRAVEAANANLEASQEDWRNTVVTLLGEVATNYIALRGNQRRLAVARDNVKTQRDTVELTKGLFAAGLNSALDVAQAQAQLASTEAQIPALETSIKQSIHQLGVLLGSEPETLVQELSAGRPVPPTPPQVPIGLPSDLLRRRPDIRRAERQLATATAQVGVATAALFPSFSLTGGAGYQSTKGSNLFSSGNQYWSYGPSINWPLFEGGRLRANIEVQNALQRQALLTYESTVLTALQDVEDAIVAYSNSRAAHKSLTQAVDSSRQAARIARELYQKGLVGFLNVLQSEGALYQAEDQLAQNDQQVATALVSLYKALGGGWEPFAEDGGQMADDR
jgi:multidrug efflux system outer membrane protein